MLASYGNMSSATILFVLNALRRRLAAPATNGSGPISTPGVAMAFGPGLVVEMCRLSYTPPKNSLDETGLTPVQLPIPQHAANV